MDNLERKEKRLKFLNELYNRGIETVESQIERIGDEVTLIKIELELKRIRIERDSKIDKIIK
jgi:hypothetical protein